MTANLTATIFGREWIEHKFVKIKGVMVLKMIRPNGQELKESELK